MTFDPGTQAWISSRRVKSVSAHYFSRFQVGFHLRCLLFLTESPLKLPKITKLPSSAEQWGDWRQRRNQRRLFLRATGWKSDLTVKGRGAAAAIKTDERWLRLSLAAPVYDMEIIWFGLSRRVLEYRPARLSGQTQYGSIRSCASHPRNEPDCAAFVFANSSYPYQGARSRSSPVCRLAPQKLFNPPAQRLERWVLGQRVCVMVSHPGGAVALMRAECAV